MKRYLWNQLLWLDQGLNSLLGPLLNWLLSPAQTARFGDPAERLSSVFGKNVKAGACKGCKAMCRVLDWIQPGHCATSIQPAEGSNADGGA